MQRVEATGLRPVFQEPEGPRMGRNFCLLPGSFQIQHFGTTIDPREISNNPGRMMEIARALSESLTELPPEAVDFLNWTETETEENGTLTIYWENPDWEQDRVG